MPAATVPKTPLAIGAGYLYYSALGTSLPTNTVVGSVFTDAWPGGWNLFGVTKNGHEFDYSITVDETDAAEYFDPLQYATTARTSGMKFELQLISITLLSKALNGGTATVVSGSGTTQLNKFTPPAPGSEVRIQIGWESTDNTERLVMEQAFQIGSLAISRNKGASNNATLPLEFRGEVAASGFPFQYFTAGTARA